MFRVLDVIFYIFMFVASLFIVVIIDFIVFCLLLFILVYLSDWSTAFTIYLLLLLGLFLSYKFLLFVAFSFPPTENPLQFLLGLVNTDELF